MSCYFRRYDKDSGKFLSKRILNREMHFTLLANKKHLEDVRLVRQAASEEAAREAKNPTQHQYLFDYNVLPNADGTVAGTTRVSNTVFVDYDSAELKAAGVTAEQVLERIVELKAETRVVFACYSLRKNVHAVFLRDPTLTQQENIEQFNTALTIEGLRPDPTCINNLREGTFATTIKDIVYIDDRLYTEEEMPNLESSSRKQTKAETSEPQAKSNVADEEPTPEAQQAWAECEKRAGLQHGQVDVPHHRYANLIAILSKDFPVYVSEESQALACIRYFMPTYWQTEEKKCRSIVNTAYHEWDNSFKMSAEAIKVNAKLQQQTPSTDEPQKPKPEWMTKAPEMPPLEELPRPLQLFLKPYPKQYWPSLAVSATVLWSAHATHFRTAYVDGRMIAPCDYSWLMGESQSGKHWIEDQRYEMLRLTLDADDSKAWAAHKENKKERARKSDNKPDRCQQALNVCQTVSNTSILELMEFQGGDGALCCFFPEAGLLAKATGFKDITDIQLEGWDGTQHTQYYTSDASVSTSVCVRLSILAISTPRIALERYFRARDNDENGLRNRYMIVALPEEEELSFRPPMKVNLTPEEQAERDGYLLSLWQKNKSINGVRVLDLPRTAEAVNAFLDRWEAHYKEGLISRAEGKLIRRVGQHMTRAAMAYVALFGGETDEVLNFINWLGEYVYFFQRQLFAEDMERVEAEGRRLLNRSLDGRTTSTADVIYDMPMEFTRQMWIEKCAAQGVSENCATTSLSRLCNRSSGKQLAVSLGKGQYRRL